MDDHQERREAAIKRLKAKRDFVRSLVAYLVVNAMLIVIWTLTDAGGYFWPIWPILGWGIALVLQGWNAYLRKPISEDDIRREIEGGK